MRLLTLTPVLACLSLAQSTNAYKLFIWAESANCSGVADYIYNFQSDGDCDGSLAGGSSLKYDSDAGCSLSTWADETCTAVEAGTNVQDECFSPGYLMVGMVANLYFQQSEVAIFASLVFTLPFDATPNQGLQAVLGLEWRDVV
ncbi:hypothetical protein G7Y79_00054g088670 [Physcia stellaris]|nr:hypothetical protein G7Y79_00054g088670 [Physcia stellaris]